jgi:hypothetical protein
VHLVKNSQRLLITGVRPQQFINELTRELFPARVSLPNETLVLRRGWMGRV